MRRMEIKRKVEDNLLISMRKYSILLFLLGGSEWIKESLARNGPMRPGSLMRQDKVQGSQSMDVSKLNMLVEKKKESGKKRSRYSLES